mgnify:CR=1 FL=1
MTCTSLDGCYFLESNMPKQPQHDNCDCKKLQISVSFVKTKAFSECSIEKFLGYVFTDDEKSKGKKSLFESWGYTKENAYELQKEYQNQALKEYLNGNYILKDLDRNGQRLAIGINLKGNSFYAGWMVDVEGKIRNTTPFGGWINEKI